MVRDLGMPPSEPLTIDVDALAAAHPAALAALRAQLSDAGERVRLVE